MQDGGPYDEEHYRDHAIRVLVRGTPEGRWAIRIEIQKPDGRWLEPIDGSATPYVTVEIALATGSEEGRRIVDQLLDQ